MTTSASCLGCDSVDSKCRRDGCSDCCYCAKPLKADRWLDMLIWRRRYGVADARFLSNFFDRAHENNSCMDNMRVCRVENSTDDERRQYEQQLREGCCGFEDAEVTAPSGVRYRVGFNYNH